MRNKQAKFMLLWIFVASFFAIFAIAFIEPFKGPVNDSMTDLGCSTTTNEFIKAVCFLEKGTVVLFVGGIILALFKWVQVMSQRGKR